MDLRIIQVSTNMTWRRLLDPHPTEGPVKFTVVCFSTCLSDRQFGIFHKNGSLVFSYFLHDGT